MRNLVAFDEVQNRLDDFTSYLKNTHKEKRPIYRGITRALIEVNWEGTPQILDDVFIDKKNDFLSFEYVLSRLGYITSAESIKDSEQFKELKPPYFITLGENLKGVVLSYKRKKAYIYDYYADLIVEKDFEALIGSDICLLNEYSITFRDQDSGTINKSDWLKYCMYQYTGVIKTLCLVSFFINLFGSLTPFYIVAVYFFALPSGSVYTLSCFVLGGILLAIAESYLKKIRYEILAEYGKDLSTYISFYVTSKLMWLPYKLTSTAGVSAQIERLRDIDKFRRLVTAESTLSYFDLPFVALFLIGILLLSGYAGLTVIIGSVCLIIFCLYSKAKYTQMMDQISLANAKVVKQWNKLLTHLQFVQGLPLLKVIEFSFITAEKQMLDDSQNLETLNSKIQRKGQAFIQIIGTSTIVVSVLCVMNGELNPAVLIGLIILVWKTLVPIMNVYNSLLRLKTLNRSSQQINALMSLEDDRANLNTSSPLRLLYGDYSISNLYFRYPNSEVGLTNLNFEIERGEKVAIVGGAGSGKTTLLEIISSLNTDYQGSVYADGYNIKQFNSYRYRQAVKYIPFDFHLFEGSLRDNFIYHNGNINDDLMEASLVDFGIEHLFKDGLNTYINKAFILKISNGELQFLRLALMLAICHQNVVVIDEPLLGCAYKHHRLFAKLLANKFKDKTVIYSTREEKLITMSEKSLLLDMNGSQRYYGLPDKVLNALKNK